jgi:hypothetical protein
MSFVVSRYKEIDGVKNYLQDMHGPGSPYQTREEAKVHLKQVLLSFKQGWFGFQFEVREIDANPVDCEEPATSGQDESAEKDLIEQALRDRKDAGIRADD